MKTTHKDTAAPTVSTAHGTAVGTLASTVLDPPRHHPLRFLLAAAALAAAAAHLPVTGPHLQEAPYMGMAFILLISTLLVLTTAALTYDNTAVYIATAVTCGLAITAYAATRTLTFPQLGDDVGNWLEPLGVVSVSCETVALASAVIVLRRTPGAPRVNGRSRDA
ncbi:MAG TPA: hypothetical protein VGE11_01860 [Pseudonocardia sp.]